MSGLADPPSPSTATGARRRQVGAGRRRQLAAVADHAVAALGLPDHRLGQHPEHLQHGRRGAAARRRQRPPEPRPRQVYVAWSKHAHYQDRNTGWNDPASQLTNNAFRSQDCGTFPKAVSLPGVLVLVPRRIPTPLVSRSQRADGPPAPSYALGDYIRADGSTSVGQTLAASTGAMPRATRFRWTRACARRRDRQTDGAACIQSTL